MTNLMLCVYVLTVLSVITIRDSFASPTPIPKNLENNPITTSPESTMSSATANSTVSRLSSESLQKNENHPQTDLLTRNPGKVILQTEAQVLGLRDYSAVAIPIEGSFDSSPDYQQPISSIAVADLEEPLALIYPVEDAAAGDMATAESNIVFRPLFTYRRRTQRRRRVSYQPTFTRTYRSGYSSYPYYYNNAPYDYVP